MSRRTPTAGSFGSQLRYWRRARGLSQLTLASLAHTTPRHVSFIETGRSRPGHDLVLRIAGCMRLPARAANALLAAAGFGPGFDERALDDEVMRPVRRVIDSVLEQHAPYPGCAIDARGRVHLANTPYLALFPKALERSAEQNIDDYFGAPGRAWIVNWPEALWAAFDLRSDYAQRSGDPELLRLAERALSHLRDVPRPVPEGSSPMIVSKVRLGDETITTFASVLRFEAARDVTLSELRIELIFPADERSDEIMRAFGERASTRSCPNAASGGARAAAAESVA